MKIALRVCSVLFGLTVILAGCTAARVRIRPPLDERGALYLYLQPIPVEAARLAFSLESVAAIKDSGEMIPLTLRIHEISVRSVSRERLLIEGELPPGRYLGVAVKARKASLTGEEDNAALQPPEEPSRIDFPFVVDRKRANVLSLTFRYAESLLGGVVFAPRFTVAPARKPPKGRLGYVVNRGSNTVTAFDKISGNISEIIPTSAAPCGMVIDPVGQSRAYVALSGEDAVEVIDLLQGSVIDRIRLTMGDRPAEMALTPDGKTLVLVNAGSSTVSVIDTVSLEEHARIRLAGGPQSVLLDATGRKAYVFHTLGSGISVIDVPNRSLAATIATESAPLRGQFNRRGDRLFVIHQWSPYLVVIDPFSLTVVRRQFIGMGYQALKVDTANDRIFLARKGGRHVEVFDPFTLIAIHFLDAGGEVSFLTIDGQENALLMLIPGEEMLRIANLVRSAPLAELDVGEDPCWVTVLGER